MFQKSLIALVIVVLCLLTGCNLGVKKEPVTLTVNFPSEKLFYQMYGDEFERENPNIRIKVIAQDLAEKSIEPSSDVLYIDQLQVYKKLVEDGKLVSLEQNIRSDKYPLSDITTVVINPLRSSADNGLYGLSPTFISFALYYNPDLFNQYGVPLPKNQMTWKEVFELAKKFPNKNSDEKRIYGFKSNYYTAIAFSLILRAGQTEGLTFINPKTLKVNIDSDQWKTIFSYVIDSFRSGSIYDQEESTTGKIEPAPILTGQAAMELQSYSTAYNFESYSKFVGATKVNWDMVTVPVSTQFKDTNDYYDIQEIYGISSKSNYKDEAWKLIKFITSNTQKIRSNIDNQLTFGLPARTDLIKSIDNHDLSALYSLKPIRTSNNPYDYINYEIINAFKVVGQKKIQNVIEGSISLEEAIQEIEIEGQQAIHDVSIKIMDNNNNSN